MLYLTVVVLFINLTTHEAPLLCLGFMKSTVNTMGSMVCYLFAPLTVFLVLLLLDSLPFFVVVGSLLCVLLTVSFSFWFASFYNFMLTILSINSTVVDTTVLTYFNSFVNILRPITLMMRILINVSLGHALLEISSDLTLSLTLAWVFELFVYVVQSLVFILLMNSYF